MIDEIDYFPRREQQKKGKTAGEEWGKLKKMKSSSKKNNAQAEENEKKLKNGKPSSAENSSKGDGS